MRKYLLILGVALLAVALTACREYDGRTAQETVITGDTIEWMGMEKTTEPVELLVWLDNEEWAMALMRAFVQHHPNVTFQFQQMGNVGSRDHMQQDGPAGHGADIFAFPHDHVTFAIADGLIEPVPPQLQAKWEGELVRSAVETVSYGGRMHAVPFQTENIGLFYNRDLWGDTPPETWEEVLEFARTYNNPDTHDWTMAWEVANAYLNYIWLTAAGFEVFGPDMDNFRTPNFDSPEVARGLEIFLSMRELFDLPIEDINFNTTEERFRLGEIPLTITGPWAINDLLENGVNFGVTRLPTIGGVQPVAFSGNIIAGVSSYSNPINKPWAYAFLDFMVSEEGAEILYQYMNHMTTRRDVDAIPGLNEDPFLLGLAKQTPYTVPMPTIPQVTQMWPAMEELFRFTWSNDLTIPEAQARAMSTYRTLLEVAGHDISW